MASEKLPWKYPASKPFRHGMLVVSKQPRHELYWEERGNPRGDAVIVLHGGPGYGCNDNMARVFDPKHYRIVLFDQRGAGRSKPFASLEENTTSHLVEDINRLRKHLGIKGKMHLFGGSWGSTLALAYAIEHPGNVKSMILRGIFLCRRADLDFFYQGNAAKPDHPNLMGAGRYFPEDWRRFVELALPEKRRDMVKAYNDLFRSRDKIHIDGREIELSLEAAKRWCQWESATVRLIRNDEYVRKYAEKPETAAAPARIENHYFMHGAFLGGVDRDQNYIIENVGRIKNIPTVVVHGRYDVVCPRDQADDLVEAWRAAQPDKRKWPVLQIVDNAGHGYAEPGNISKLTEATDRFRQAVPVGRAKGQDVRQARRRLRGK